MYKTCAGRWSREHAGLRTKYVEASSALPLHVVAEEWMEVVPWSKFISKIFSAGHESFNHDRQGSSGTEVREISLLQYTLRINSTVSCTFAIFD